MFKNFFQKMSTPSSTLGEWHIFGCACLKHKWLHCTAIQCNALYSSPHCVRGRLLEEGNFQNDWAVLNSWLALDLEELVDLGSSRWRVVYMDQINPPIDYTTDCSGLMIDPLYKEVCNKLTLIISYNLWNTKMYIKIPHTGDTNSLDRCG